MLKKLARAHLFILPAVALACVAAGEEEAVRVTPENFLPEIAARLDETGRLPEGCHFLLSPGDYHLAPAAYIDSTCGNCEDANTPVAATLGLRLAGRGVVLEGEDADSVLIHTHAGYGILFQDCTDCALAKLTVTGGVRDPDPNATDAAVVVQRSSVLIDGCIIKENLGDSTLIAENVVGVIGIAGREGADLSVRNNRILRNSWDGIALYRGARAEIRNNLIDGVDKAGGRVRGGGRGVGIGVTWDARAEIRGNRVTRYWKGIGLFVDAQGEVAGNVVEEILTWGIALWDAGKGRPVGRIEGNVIYDTGACGISIARESEGEPPPGYCRRNVIVKTGQNPKYDDPDYYCAQCPLAVHARPDDFEIRDNLLFDNRRALAGVDRTLPRFEDLAEDEYESQIGRRLARLIAASSGATVYSSQRNARCFLELPSGPN